MEGAGAKRRRDGTASVAAAKAAESSGDDRFSLSKFKLDERFQRRGKDKVDDVDIERSEEELEEFENDSDGGGGSDGDDADDGNYDIDDDDDQEGPEVGIAGGSDGEGAPAKSKKMSKKLKPMSADELAAFMKVTRHLSARCRHV